MLNSLGLGFLFRAKDEASEVIEHLKEGHEQLGEAAEKAHHSITDALGMSGKALAGTAVAIGAIATGGAFEFAEHAEKFSSAIRQAGVASHATAEQMEALEHLAINKGLDSMRESAINVADTLRQLALEGMDADDAGRALDGTLQLVRISMGALGARDAAGIVNDTLAQFGMKADQSGELTDKLAFAMKNFGFRAEELRGTMIGLASGAQLTGASLDDTLISVGLVKSVFPSATKAAMSMNAAMQQLASTHAQKELRGIGVSVTDTTGKIRPLIEVLDQIAKKTAHMTEAQVAHRLATIAGGRAAGGLSAIMDGLRKGVKDASGNVLTGSAAIMYLRDQISNTQGTAKKMAEILGDDLGGALKALKNGISNAGVAFGSSFEGPFKNAVQTVNLFVRGMTQLFTQGGFSGEVKDALDKNLGLKDFVVGVFIWIKRLQNFFSELGASFRTAFAPFQPILDMLLDTFSRLGQALGLTNQSAGQNASTWDSFGAAGASIGSILANLAGAVLPLLVTGMQILIMAVEAVMVAWEALKPTISTVGQVFSGVFHLIAGIFTGDWNMMWNGFVDTVVGAAKLVVNTVIAMVSIVTGLIDKMAGAFGVDLGITEKVRAFQMSLNEGVNSGTDNLKALVSTSTSAPAAGAIAQTQAHAAALEISRSAHGADAGEQTIHLHTNVNVDGEKLAEAHVRAKREANARGFQPVPAHEGGF